MQLIYKPKKRLLTRMFVTSLSIIALVGFGLAWLVTQLHAQNRYAQIVAEYIAELPVIAAEFRENNLVPITQAEDNDNIETSYIMATCNNHFNTLWQSKLAKELSLTQICEKYGDIIDESQSYYLEFEGLPTYLVFKLSTVIDGKAFHLLILKNAEKIAKELSTFNRLTYFRLAMVLAAAVFLLMSAAYWGMLPLKQLKQELIKLKQGKQQNLSDDYPVELQEITQALNQLIIQSQQRSRCYERSRPQFKNSLSRKYCVN